MSMNRSIQKSIYLSLYLSLRPLGRWRGMGNFLDRDLWTGRPPSPLGVKNVKNQENSEKIRGPGGTHREPL